MEPACHSFRNHGKSISFSVTSGHTEASAFAGKAWASSAERASESLADQLAHAPFPPFQEFRVFHSISKHLPNESKWNILDLPVKVSCATNQWLQCIMYLQGHPLASLRYRCSNSMLVSCAMSAQQSLRTSLNSSDSCAAEIECREDSHSMHHYSLHHCLCPQIRRFFQRSMH